MRIADRGGGRKAGAGSRKADAPSSVFRLPPPVLAAAPCKRLIVFDYDGTLADLPVDWVTVRTDLSRRARDFGFMSTFQPLWPQLALLREARGPQAVAALFAVLAEHELLGVVQQQPRAEIVAFARLLAQAEGGSSAVS